MGFTTAEQIMYSTMQIEMLDYKNQTIGYASGFIYSFCHDKETNKGVRALITNRHVLGGCPKIKIIFTKRGDDGLPIQHEQINVIADTSSVIFHPDQSIDLAAMLLSPALEAITDAGEREFFYYIDSSSIPSDIVWNTMDAVEDLLMVGYPLGMRDKINNLPIFRRGSTATHPKYDFQGKPQFLMDMSCFRGSSGSPVYRYYDGAFHGGDDRSFQFGTRCELIGIQYQSATYSELGELVPISTESKIVSSTTVFVNLGYALKSTLLLDFEPIIQQMLIK